MDLSEYDPKQIIQTKESMRVKAIGVQPVLKYIFKICSNLEDIEIEHFIENDSIIINKPLFLNHMSSIYRDCDYTFKKKAVSEILIGNTNNLITMNRRKREGIAVHEYTIKYQELYEFMNDTLGYYQIKHLFDV
jgi:hypothetical protein